MENKNILKKDFLNELDENFKNKNMKVLQNSIVKNGITNTILDNDNLNLAQHIYSENIETGKVANQKQSGRCWIFAALNTFRHKLNREFNLKDFELSQTYVFFYDKLEKSNYFLNAIIETIEEDIDSRIVHHLLTTPQQDGGQWDMLVSLIKKYGVVPKSSMPDPFHSTSSMELNKLLNRKLRKNASILRKDYEENKDRDRLYSLQKEMITEIYNYLSSVLGNPPKTIDFEYYDKDGKFHRELNITPIEFYNKYVGMNLDDYVSIINAPTKDKPYYKTFTVDFLGNVLGGQDVKYLNVPINVMKELVIKQIQNKETIWFGCDVGQFSNSKLGVLDDNTFNYSKSFNIDFEMTKEDTLDYCESLMTHAMVISGVNLIDGKPNRYKVENTWGDEVGNNGYFVMTDTWFDKYVYQVVINKKYMDKELIDKLNQEPIILKPWDPMGSLALSD